MFELLDIPDHRVQKLSVLAVTSYVLTLVNSVFGISISCNGGAKMGAVEYYARMLAAIALFLGLGWVCLVRHDLWSSMWGAATYFDLLLAHLGSTADSTIYLLEDSITEMEFLPWALYPASFPLGVCATVVLEVIRESNDYYVALKLAMALMLGGGLG